MRPDILNPLFRTTDELKGVGKGIARPLERLKLSRVRDLLYHRPTGWVERRRIETLDDAQEGDIVIIALTTTEHRGGGGPRSPLRIMATDRVGNHVSLIFFGKNPGWPKKLLPLGETKIVSGKLERYGDELQIVHPDHVLAPGEDKDLRLLEPVYPLSEGLTNGRLCGLIEQALGDVPELPEWAEPGLVEQRKWPDWRRAIGQLHHSESKVAVERLAYDEIFANQLALMLNRAHRQRKRGMPLQ